MDRGSCKLIISDLRIWLYLGCSDQEKFHPQLVRFDIEIAFNALQEGAITDRLEDTVCYLEITERIKFVCQNKRFNLIEYLTTEIYRAIAELLAPHGAIVSHINVITRKISPPVDGIHGTAVESCL